MILLKTSWRPSLFVAQTFKSVRHSLANSIFSPPSPAFVLPQFPLPCSTDSLFCSSFSLFLPVNSSFRLLFLQFLVFCRRILPSFFPVFRVLQPVPCSLLTDFGSLFITLLFLKVFQCLILLHFISSLFRLCSIPVPLYSPSLCDYNILFSRPYCFTNRHDRASRLVSLMPFSPPLSA